MISLAHLHGTLPGEAVRWTMVGHVEMGHTHQSSTDWAGPLQSGGNRSTGLHSTGGSSYHSSSHHFTSHRLTWLTQSWPGQIWPTPKTVFIIDHCWWYWGEENRLQVCRYVTGRVDLLLATQLLITLYREQSSQPAASVTWYSACLPHYTNILY